MVTLFEDAGGDIWAGTKEGLNRFDRKTGKILRYLHGRDPVPVNSIRQDGEGTLWLGTGNGLCRFAPLKGECEYVDDNTRQKSVDNLQLDDNGNVWYTTEDGLSKYNERLETTVNFRHGLHASGFLTSWYDPASGEMFFGGLDGIVSFYPRRIRISRFLPTVLITEFRVHGKPLEPGGEGGLDKPIWFAGFEDDTLTLEHDRNTITFEFAALCYSSVLEKRYMYILENGEEKWNNVGAAGRTVTYSNLKPGEYLFRIRGSSGNGLWNERESTLRVVIKPLWWKTTWFRGCVVFLAALAVLGIYKLRVNVIVRRNILLEKLVDERTKELRKKNEMIAQQAKIMGRLAKTDPLTGLANRRDFLERATEEHSRVERHGGCFCVVMGDIDFFKKVNDTFGHDGGDYVLETTAELMNENTREQDIKARWGGEEFIMLLPETELHAGGRFADKLREAIAGFKFKYNDDSIEVHMTFGVALCDGSEAIAQCINHADEALYTGKESGRNRVVLYGDT